MRFWLELALSNFRQLQIEIYLRIDKILPWAALEQLRDDLYAMRGMGTPTPFLAASLGVAPLRLARRYINKILAWPGPDRFPLNLVKNE